MDSLPQSVTLVLHARSGEPYALRLNLRRASTFLACAFATLLLTLVGTLLFFRELDVNRDLQEQVLDLQTREKLAALIQTNERLALQEKPRDFAAKTQRLPASLHADRDSIYNPEAGTTVNAHLTEVTSECAPGECAVKLSLAPASPGNAQGQIVVILEAEIPRIGGATPTSQPRKRYVIYPGGTSRDDMDEKTLAALPGKAFHFTRALHTTANLTFGKFLRPLAINVYVLNADKSLVQHERKPLEIEE